MTGTYYQDSGQGEEGAAFVLSLVPGVPAPVLIAVPHAGRYYDLAGEGALRDERATQLRLEDRFVDMVGEAAAGQTGASLLVTRTARAVIDLNRSPEDIDWGMIEGSAGKHSAHSASNMRARHGLGLIPRRVHGLGELWRRRLRADELEQRLALVHRPYHLALAETLETIRDRWGHALLVDLHSMPPLPRAASGPAAAEFVIGDRFDASCASALAHRAIRHLETAGRAVAHNRPYSGGYTLDRHAAPRRGIHAIQVEICRSTYLDARLDQPGPRLPAVARLIAGLVRALAAEMADLASAQGWRNAAE